MRTTIILPIAAALSLVSAEAKTDPLLPDFGAATFAPSAPITNPFFPLLPGTLFVYEGEEEDEGEIISQRIETLVTGRREPIFGVDTLAVRSLEFEDGLLVEETFDFYAQDSDGNVWYFGEDVTNFEFDDDGNLIGTNNDGQWRAGENGALPGYIMPGEALLAVGFNYFEEFAPNDDAVDEGTIFALGEMIAIDLGSFDDVLRILETTAIEPDVFEFKNYARGLGLILIEEDLDPDDFSDVGFSLELISVSQVPEPAMPLIFGGGLMALAAARRLRSQAAGS